MKPSSKLVVCCLWLVAHTQVVGTCDGEGDQLRGSGGGAETQAMHACAHTVVGDSRYWRETPTKVSPVAWWSVVTAGSRSPTA